MYLKKLRAIGVRNLARVNLDFCSGVNHITGNNGSGKSSLLEAIYLLTLGRSFLTPYIRPVINQQQQQMLVFGQLYKPGSNIISLGLLKTLKGKNRLRVNGKEASSLADLAQYLPVQLINPDSFRLLNAGPKYRRQLLDWLLFHVEHEFLAVWLKVQRLLKQRNALLRTPAVTYANMKIWDDTLVKHASRLDDFRRTMADLLIERFHQLIKQLSDADVDLTMEYYSGWNTNLALIEVLKEQFTRDCRQGFTQYGPHRADLKLKKDNIAAEQVLSRGQQKLVVCSLKLAQSLLLRELTNKNTTFLVDDLAAELDRGNRVKIVNFLVNMGVQLFITSVNKESLAGCLPDKGQLFHVEQGVFSTGIL